MAPEQVSAVPRSQSRAPANTSGISGQPLLGPAAHSGPVSALGRGGTPGPRGSPRPRCHCPEIRSAGVSAPRAAGPKVTAQDSEGQRAEPGPIVRVTRCRAARGAEGEYRRPVPPSSSLPAPHRGDWLQCTARVTLGGLPTLLRTPRRAGRGEGVEGGVWRLCMGSRSGPLFPLASGWPRPGYVTSRWADWGVRAPATAQLLRLRRKGGAGPAGSAYKGFGPASSREEPILASFFVRLPCRPISLKGAKPGGAWENLPLSLQAPGPVGSGQVIKLV